MSKIILNYDQQIEKLRNEKNLRIDDIGYAKNILRQLFLRYLIKVENEIKSRISYYFTEKNGEEKKEYLDTANYNYKGTQYIYGKMICSRL